jgi:putative membrane protein
MTQEALLAYAHLLAILTMVVFLTSEAALCRPEWLNAAMVERLAKIDAIYGLSAVLVLATGLARVFWGVKGSGWYWANPLLYVKLGLFVAIALLSIRPTLQFLRWRKALRAGGTLPDEAAVRKVRRLVMVQAHLIPVVPLAAVFLARGFGG